MARMLPLSLYTTSSMILKESFLMALTIGVLTGQSGRKIQLCTLRLMTKRKNCFEIIMPEEKTMKQTMIREKICRLEGLLKEPRIPIDTKFEIVCELFLLKELDKKS